jgi:hypothetical protein
MAGQRCDFAGHAPPRTGESDGRTVLETRLSHRLAYRLFLDTVYSRILAILTNFVGRVLLRHYFIIGAALLAGLITVPDAKASHIFFQNIRINGQAINDPGQQNVFTSPSGGIFTFEADFWGPGDFFNVTFNPLAGSTLALSNFSFQYTGGGTQGSPLTLTNQQTPGIGTFTGTFQVASNQSSPDFISRANQQLDNPVFNLTVTQTEAVPEPSTWALLGSGFVAMVVRKRRK